MAKTKTYIKNSRELRGDKRIPCKISGKQYARPFIQSYKDWEEELIKAWGEHAFEKD